MKASNKENTHFRYTITKKAQKQLKKFSKRDQEIYMDWITNKLVNISNPRQLEDGKKLKGRRGYIRCKVNHDLRLILIIDEKEKTFEIKRFMRRGSNPYSSTKPYLF